MSIPCHLKTSNPLEVNFSTESPSSISSCRKMKTPIHTLILTHLCRFFRAFSKVKSIIVDHLILHPHRSKPHNYFKYKKIFLGSFRLHYNWGSTTSHLSPPPAPPPPPPVADDCFSTTTVLPQLHAAAASRGSTARSWRFPCSQRTLSGYLQWLDETSDDDGESVGNHKIDTLADLFIANCHEKFILEKQESDRKFQDMLARGL